MTPGRRHRGEPEPEAQPEPTPEPVVETPAPPAASDERELAEAASAFRVFSHAFRGFERLNGAIEAALGARQRAAQAEKRVGDADAALSTLLRAKDDLDAQIALMKEQHQVMQNTLREQRSQLEEARAAITLSQREHVEALAQMRKEHEAEKARLAQDRYEAETKLGEAKAALAEHFDSIAARVGR